MDAAVGVTETTTEPRPDAFPGNDKIKIWDLPGANTTKFPISRYAEEFQLLIDDAEMARNAEDMAASMKSVIEAGAELSNEVVLS